MKKFLFVSSTLLTIFLSVGPSQSDAFNLILNNTPIQVYFGPHGGCTEAIIGEINKAKTEILVQAYSFTSQPIAMALLAGHKRGVDGLIPCVIEPDEKARPNRNWARLIQR